MSDGSVMNPAEPNYFKWLGVVLVVALYVFNGIANDAWRLFDFSAAQVRVQGAPTVGAAPTFVIEGLSISAPGFVVMFAAISTLVGNTQFLTAGLRAKNLLSLVFHGSKSTTLGTHFRERNEMCHVEHFKAANRSASVAA